MFLKPTSTPLPSPTAAAKDSPGRGAKATKMSLITRCMVVMLDVLLIRWADCVVVYQVWTTIIYELSHSGADCGCVVSNLLFWC